MTVPNLISRLLYNDDLQFVKNSNKKLAMSLLALFLHDRKRELHLTGNSPATYTLDVTVPRTFIRHFNVNLEEGRAP